MMLNILLKVRDRKNNKGFTLVELIVVIAIMAMLAIAITPRLTQFLDKSKITTDKEIANTVSTAFKSVSLDAEAYATMPAEYRTGDGVDLLTTPGGTDTDYFYYTNGGSGHKYTAKIVVGKTLGKFEQTVKEILPADFTLKSDRWTSGTVTMKVLVSGQGIVKVKLSNGTVAEDYVVERE